MLNNEGYLKLLCNDLEIEKIQCFRAIKSEKGSKNKLFLKFV